MIRFRIEELMEERGMKKPKYAPFKREGISHDLMKRYKSGKKEEMSRKHTEIFCRLLRCTPNDLYEWIPDTGLAPLDERHPLHTIKPREKFSLDEELKKLTADEIKKKLRGGDEKKDEDAKK